ncbi:MAG: hypothetical protein ACFFDN_50705 [Candidatus Hodarchaeota archaeon]
MGNCQYCGKPTGFLKKKHPECERLHKNGWKSMLETAKKSVMSGEGFNSLLPQLENLARKSYISKGKIREVLIQGWSNAVTDFLDDGVLSEEEEKYLTEFQEHFNLSQSELDSNGSLTKTVKAAILRDVLNGEIPEKINIKNSLPFNLQKTEKMIWLFNNVEYYEEKTRRHYEGGHQGFSIRVAKGLYYRAGAFKGYPVEKTEIVPIDIGLMGITNKHIYFTGDRKSFRVKYDKIVSFTPYDDGIGIQRDAASAKPQIFKTNDGWFSYNLISNLAQI